MSDNREFDQAVDRWLDDGSDATPPGVIDAVLLAARTTPQERDLRILWRTSAMRRLAYAATAVAALGVGVAVLSALGPRFGIGSESTPNEQPSVDLGIFEPIAGRIIYHLPSSVDSVNASFWAFDPNAPADPAMMVRLTSEGGIPLGWSSDGTRLLIMRVQEGQLFVVHADGSETQLTEPPMAIRGATISPDGSRVVFQGGTGEGSAQGLYAVDADGGPARMLREVSVADLSFSPDGTQIAYVDWGRGDSEHSVWLMDADGRNAHQILANGITLGGGHARGIAWSPAGDRIALGLEGSIYTFAPDGSDFIQIAGGDGTCESLESCALNIPRMASLPYWSPDGSRIAYTTGCRNGSGAIDQAGCILAIADADGSNVVTFGFGASGPWHPGKVENGAGE